MLFASRIYCQHEAAVSLAFRGDFLGRGKARTIQQDPLDVIVQQPTCRG